MASAREHLQRLLEVDPNFKYGEASLTYAKIIVDLQDVDGAIVHLEKHLKEWANPEAYIMIAALLSQQGDRKSARDRFETMLYKLKGSSYHHYQRNRHFIKKAERLLKTL